MTLQNLILTQLEDPENRKIMNYKLIQFILQELKNNPEDRERFNKLTYHEYYKDKFKMYDIYYRLNHESNRYIMLELKYCPDTIIKHIIRTALSRTRDGKAVLSALEGESDEYKIDETHWIEKKLGLKNNQFPIRSKLMDKSELLYRLFGCKLYNGSTLKEALEACEQYFIEEEGIIKLNI